MKLPLRHLPLLAALATALLSSCVTSALEERGVDSDEYGMRKELADPGTLSRRDLQVGGLMTGMPDSGAMTAKRIFAAAKDHVDPGMTVFTIGGEGADHAASDAPSRIDVLVATADGSSDALASFVANRGQRADYLLSLGSGAFLLARAGLLNDTHATTTPSERQTLASGFPRVIVHERMSFVHDGKAITSVGGDEAQDAALYLCEHLYGEPVASAIAKDLGLNWRSGGAASLIPRDRPEDLDRRVGDAVDRAKAEGSRLLPQE